MQNLGQPWSKVTSG